MAKLDTHANDKEHPTEERFRYQMKNHKQGASHGTDDGQAHQKMRDSLLSNTLSDQFLLINIFSVNSLDYVELALVCRQGVSMYRSLEIFSNMTFAFYRRTFTCGTSPFGNGISMIPAMKLVQPRRKKSQ